VIGCLKVQVSGDQDFPLHLTDNLGIKDDQLSLKSWDWNGLCMAIDPAGARSLIVLGKMRRINIGILRIVL